MRLPQFSIIIVLALTTLAMAADFPPPSIKATVWTKWQDVPTVPTNIEKAVAQQESSDNPNVGVHQDGTSVGWFGITPGFVHMLIEKKWIPKQKYNLNNGWENRWLFRRGLQYFYKDSKDWNKALAKFHGSSDPKENSRYVVQVLKKVESL